MLGKICAFVLLSFSFSAFAGSPSTQPTTKPGAKPEATTLHKMELLQLNIPKTWKLAGGDVHQVSFLIGVVPKDRMPTAAIKADKCCPCSETTDTIADGNKTGMSGQHGDETLTCVGDETITISGAHARMISFDVKAMVLKPGAKKKTPMLSKRCFVYMKEDGNLYNFSFITDAAGAQKRVDDFKKLVESVELIKPVQK